MRQDEQTPLSRAKLQQQIVEEKKVTAITAFIPLLFVTLLAIGFTAAVCKLYAVALPLFWIFLVIGALPFWVGVAILLYRAWKAVKRYREDSRRDFLEIETDSVSDLTEETELHHSGRMAYQDRAYVVYLEKHGRCVIDRTLWHILKEGDKVYVAVTLREKPQVYRVYSTVTHRIMENET
ncbi:MAG: hypothetical protein IJX72_07610 [Clostridia bacterium]|nr:hypothetical protein [Clostridia bacterium]